MSSNRGTNNGGAGGSMSSNRGTNNGGAGGPSIPPAARKIVQSLKEIVNRPELEIYATLKDCHMDPDEAVSRLLSQDPFREVKSKRDKKKESKDSTESRSHSGSNTSSRGRGMDRYAGRGGSTQFSSSDSGALHGKVAYRKENGTNPYTSSSSTAPGVAAHRTFQRPPAPSDFVTDEKKSSSLMADGNSLASQPSTGYQPAWVGAHGQKSMADIVKMGRPQIKASSTPTSSHYSVEDVKASVSSETANMHQLSIQEDDHEVSSKGTTIVACIYAHGIIVACDSRGSCDIGTPEDPRVLIVDDEVTKIYRLGDHMVCTVAGNVKNCVDTIEKLFNSCNKFHERNDRQPSAHFASSSMLDIYKKDFPVKKDFKCGTIIASCDKEGPLMYYLTSDSFLRLRGLLFTQGSGGAYAYRYMQYWYHYDMDADYAAALAVASIEFAARYDSYTGGTATGIRILVWRTMLQVIQQFARMAG